MVLNVDQPLQEMIRGMVKLAATATTNTDETFRVNRPLYPECRRCLIFSGTSPQPDYLLDSGFDLCGIGNRVRGADSISAIASSNSEESVNGDNRGQGKGRLAVFNGSGFHLSSLKIWVDSPEGFDISITVKNVLRLEWSTLQYFLVSGDGRARQVRIVISSVLLHHRVIDSFEHKLTFGG